MQQQNKFAFICSFLVTMSLIYSQIYLVSLPTMAHYFLVTKSHIQFAYTMNMLGLGFSQFVYGPLSDRYGRKIILIFGISLALLGNLLSALSFNLVLLCSAQLIVGLGAAACSIIPRAIARDVFDEQLLIKVIAYMSMGSVIASSVSPILGSLLEGWFGWRAIYIFLAVLTSIFFILIFYVLPETRPKNNHISSWQQVLIDYGHILRDAWFIRYISLSAFAYSIVVIYLIMSPFVFQQLLHYSLRQNSWIYFACAGAYFLGNHSVTRLIMIFSLKKIIFLGLISLIIGVIFLLYIIHFHYLTSVLFLCCGIFLHFGSGMITPITFKQILSMPRFSAGITSAAMGSMRILIAFFISTVGSYFALRNLNDFFIIISGLVAASIVAYFFIMTIE